MINLPSSVYEASWTKRFIFGKSVASVNIIWYTDVSDHVHLTEEMLMSLTFNL